MEFPHFSLRIFFFLCPRLIKKKKKKEKVSVSPRRFDSRSPSGFRADLCEGPDKAEQGLVLQAWGSTREIIIHQGIRWWAPFYSTGQSHISQEIAHTVCTYTHRMIICCHATLVPCRLQAYFDSLTTNHACCTIQITFYKVYCNAIEF